MSMMDVKKVSVVELFSKFHVTLKEAWLNEVLEYLQVERADADIPTLVQLVYEQWLFSDLSNSTRPKIRLSPFQKKTFLDCNVVVQINWMIDIHSSMYSKLNQYIGHNIDNSSFCWESGDGTENLDSKDRMYLMEVTDGQRKLRAIEYQKIDKLCGNLLRGAKLLIYGGTICRRNVLFLSSTNVMILGGESEICQQNASALVIVQRLGMDEKKLNLTKCVKNVEHENSVVEKTQSEGAKKIQTIIPSDHNRKNVVSDSSGQQNASIHTSRTVKEENAKGKKQKRLVLSRTITSYFHPQHKTHTSQVCSKDSTKSQIALVGKGIKKEKVESPPILISINDSKEQSQCPTVTITYSQEFNEPPARPTGPSATAAAAALVVPQVICTESELNGSKMKSEFREITEKPINTMQYQSHTVEKLYTTSQLRMQPEEISLSAKLRTENLETTRSPVVDGNGPTFSTRKIHDTDNAVKNNEEKEEKTVAINDSCSIYKPYILVPSTDLQQNSTDKTTHGTIISASNISEPTIWSANNNWRHINKEYSKQFLANEFHVPAQKVQMQTTDDGNDQLTEPPPLPSLRPLVHHSIMDHRPQNSSMRQTSRNIQTDDVVASKIVFEPSARRYHCSGILLPISGQNHCGLSIANSQQNSVPSHASQNLFTNSEPQQVPGGSMDTDTSFTNRPTTLILPDTTLRIVPHVNIIQRYHALNIVSIREAYNQRRYCLVAHRKRVQPIFCKLHSGLQFIGQKWTAALRIADESYDALDCLVHNDAISNLIGFTPQEAHQAAATGDRIRITYYKGRAQAMLEIFKRLDLVLTIEFSTSSNVLPLIVDITNLSTALGLC